MSLLDTLRKTLTPEMFTQVTDQLGDDFDYDLVPRTRLNKVITQRNDLRKQVLGASQPQTQKPKAQTAGKTQPEDDDDDDSGTGEIDVAALKAQWEKEQGDRVKEVRIQFAALEKLRAAKAIDPELIWSSSVIDKSKLDIDATGALIGMDDILADLTKTRAKLFETGDSGVDKGTGKNGGGDDFSGVTSKADFMKLTTPQQLAFKQANPEVFKTFLNN